jgi:hypothetical protein
MEVTFFEMLFFSIVLPFPLISAVTCSLVYPSVTFVM